MRRKRGERERLRSVGRSFDRRRRRARVEYEMRLCATSLLKSTAPTDGMLYLKGKTRCDVERASGGRRSTRRTEEPIRAREVSAGLHIQRARERASCALVRAKIFREQTHASEAGRHRQEGGKEGGFGIIGVSSAAGDRRGRPQWLLCDYTPTAQFEGIHLP